MDPLSLIIINCDAKFRIIDINENGLKYLGYDNIKEIEYKSIATIIPQPSSSLHQQIFNEMSKTYTDKSKYFRIADIANTSMNVEHTDTSTYILSKLQSKIDTKSVLTKDGVEKKAFIYVDMLDGRDCNVYMYPVFDYDPSESQKNTELEYHPELAPYRTSALVSVLRKVKNIIYK
jgi:hypothetical protein